MFCTLKKISIQDLPMRLPILEFVSCHILLCFNQKAMAAFCSGNTFHANSTYVKNVNLALYSLSSSVISNRLFYTTKLGESPDTVHALALCRGDYNAETCSTCINLAINDTFLYCPNKQESVTWGWDYDNTCIVRYANRPIFKAMETSPTMPITAGSNVSTNFDQFSHAWDSLMDNLVTTAVAGNSSYNLTYFATGELNVNSYNTIYGMVQCTPDLVPSQCRVCLHRAIEGFQSCCSGRQGGSFLSPSCFIKYELYLFYDVPPTNRTTPNITDTNPPIHKEKMFCTSPIVIAINVAVDILLIIIIFLIGIYFRKRNPGVKDTGESIRPNSLEYEFDIIKLATDEFCERNKLGQGGFGAVYKGLLPDGQEIAVKRLAWNSAQGEQEFKNEVLLLAKLQHRNLVKLLGFCLEREERILIYDGYMAPEYAAHGHFSVRSDAYSFGILVLEIVSGQKNKCFCVGEEIEHLLSLAWKHWRDGAVLNFADPVLRSTPRNELMRCIHIGLLCVQENVASRPTMARIVSMLNGCPTTLEVPSKPAFLMHTNAGSGNSLQKYTSLAVNSHQSTGKSARASINEVSISELRPR
ncbi:Gnk2-homologous domain [Dillenia turbinata]|uniref:Gnk2-homologous domain n=1 Tax=Dillenia turbinata TaxID=194707 RepID=A0AAN8UXT1_9MAGN